MSAKRFGKKLQNELCRLQDWVVQEGLRFVVVLFDRSWCNRAGVEQVMGFCNEVQYQSFLRVTPMFERHFIEDGIILIKYFFDMSQEVQEQRFLTCARDRRKHWRQTLPLSTRRPVSIRRWRGCRRLTAVPEGRHACRAPLSTAAASTGVYAEQHRRRDGCGNQGDQRCAKP